MRLPAAVLFDMDGTLVQTEHLWYDAESQIMADLAVDWGHEHQAQLVGGPLETAVDYMVRHSGHKLGHDEMTALLLATMENNLRTRPVEWCPGARELLLALEDAGVPCEVVPGITAALAAAAALKTSLTQRGSARSITFATPRVGVTEPDSTWAQGLAAADAGAIYMGVGEAEMIARTLVASGKPARLPVAVVESASLPEQRVLYTTLGDLPQLASACITGPALILIGPQFRARVIGVERCSQDKRAASA
jgi:ribonucleotide monophosphatase NagD (HAD superfamily)